MKSIHPAALVGAQRLKAWTAAVAMAALTGTAQAGLVGLSSGTPGALYQINASTGAASAPVTVGATGTSLVGLEYLGGKFYGTDVLTSGGFTIGTIDPVTGAYVALGNQNRSANWHGLAGSESAQLLYSIDLNNANSLMSITTTGVVTTIGATAPSVSGRGMAYDDANGILYATGVNQLFRIDTATASATLIGNLGFDAANMVGLAYDEDAQTLFANTGSALYTVNVTTGAGTLVGSNGVAGVFLDGLAWVPNARNVPEPSALALAGIALMGMMVLRRSRRA